MFFIETMIAIFALLTPLFLIGAFVGYLVLYYVVAKMAERRGRSAVLWILVSIFSTPFLAMFLLWVLGYNTNYRSPYN